MNIGDNIRKHRIEKDKKQQEIYEAIGVNQSTYSKIENNKYKMDIETLKNIANVLEVDITKLIGEDKIEINHTNNDSSNGGSGIIVNNNHSEDLIIALKEQITLLGKINAKLEEENQSLKDQLKKVQ
jgi:transcriptional regulator with XRE-family HTH domain